MNLNKAISARIIQLINERNWTAFRLAYESGLANSTVSNVILGKCKSCNLDTVINLCRGLRIEITEFVNSDMFLLKNLSDN